MVERSGISKQLTVAGVWDEGMANTQGKVSPLREETQLRQQLPKLRDHISKYRVGIVFSCTDSFKKII
jgi:hypothetical protein